MNRLFLLIVLTFVNFLRGCNSVYEQGLHNASCSPFLSAAAQLNDANKTFIYRCRHSDDCGGVGDRMAGVMGAAFFAIASERSFRIQWHGLEHFFRPGHVNWTYDAESLGIPHLDENGQELDHSKTRARQGQGEMQFPFPGNHNIAMFNDLNTRAISDPKKQKILERFAHVYFHSNRSPGMSIHNMTAKTIAGLINSSIVEPTREGHYVAYRCLFNDIFQPTASFLNSSYKAIGYDAMPLQDVMAQMTSNGALSLAFHYRIDDNYVAADNATATIDEETIQWLVLLSNNHSTNSIRLNLFFISNSPASAHKVLQHHDVQSAYAHIFSQELTGSRHINSADAKNSTTTVVVTFQQAMQDWWIMKNADILVCGYSGFCMSAGIVASLSQIKYNEVLRTKEVFKPQVCSNRDCAR